MQMVSTLFFRMVLRKFSEITNNKPIFSYYNTFHRYKYFFFQPAFWSLFNHCQKKLIKSGASLLCVVALLVFVFCCVLTTGRCNAFQHYGPLQCFSTYFRKLIREWSFTAHISRLCYFLWLCLKRWKYIEIFVLHE